MKAIVYDAHGTEEVLQYRDVSDPRAGQGQVEVAVKACSINHLDLWARKGMPGVKLPLPHIGGSDVAGTVASVGAGVEGLKAGDRVIVAPGMGCGDCAHCLHGWDSLCDRYNILGFQIDGGYAEKVVVPARRVVPVSDKWSFEEWASVPLVFLTAWHMLHTHAGIRSGKTVLVHAAGSGIGSAAIQIAKLAGAEVITTVGSADKVSKAKALGADHVVLYRDTDFAEAVKALTGGRGVDIIFEHIGPDTWNKNLSCLAKGGHMVTCGATSGPKVEMDLRFVYMRQQSITGSYMGGKAELLTVLGLIGAGKLKPVVDTVFALKDARQAHERMESRKFFGKLVLKV